MVSPSTGEEARWEQFMLNLSEFDAASAGNICQAAELLSQSHTCCRAAPVGHPSTVQPVLTHQSAQSNAGRAGKLQRQASGRVVLTSVPQMDEVEHVRLCSFLPGSVASCWFQPELSSSCFS